MGKRTSGEKRCQDQAYLTVGWWCSPWMAHKRRRALPSSSLDRRRSRWGPSQPRSGFAGEKHQVFFDDSVLRSFLFTLSHLLSHVRFCVFFPKDSRIFLTPYLVSADHVLHAAEALLLPDADGVPVRAIRERRIFSKLIFTSNWD